MPSDVVIKVENLGKKYNLQHQLNQGEGLRHVVQRALTAPFRWLSKKEGPSESGESAVEEFWALRDLNFEIKRGEMVGVIGRNGAGKSTLLKILSRITEPTTGRIEINGRVASLLEVGTGFHPDLSGRENIYLNGTILGMTRKEISRKFDEIVAFAEIEKFLDTPVKHYSSGMYVRLAFSVAAHMEPEILILDEVLAVGDAQFQKKCLGKMEDVSTREGRTVLFVSHNMSAVTQLCSRAITLSHGQVKFMGPVDQAIAEYLSTGTTKSGFLDARNLTDRTGPGGARVTSIRMLDGAGQPCAEFYLGGDMVLEIEIETTVPIDAVSLALKISTNEGLNLAHIVSADSNFALENLGRKEKLRVKLNDLRLYPGAYVISFYINSMVMWEIYDHLEHCMEFTVISDGRLTQRELPRNTGLFFLTPDWKRLPAEEPGVAR